MKRLLSRCPFCNQRPNEADFLCSDCREAIEAYRKIPKCTVCGQPSGAEPLCESCKKKLPSFHLATTCYFYHGKMKEALLDYKFRHQFYKAKGFAKLMKETIEALGVEIDLITAVPTGFSSIAAHGYNSPLEMAYLLKQYLKRPLYPGLLRKKPFVKRQSSLNRERRLQNVKGSFLFAKWHQKKMKGKQILLVDDVYTTGATANECSRILKKNGAAAVYVVTLLGGSPD